MTEIIFGGVIHNKDGDAMNFGVYSTIGILMGMPDIYVKMHSVNEDGVDMIRISVGSISSDCSEEISMSYLIDEIAAFGFDVIVQELYRDLKGRTYAKKS